MIKKTEVLNAWGPTVTAIVFLVGAIVAWEKKHELPDHYEPATVEDVDVQLEPVQKSLDNSDYNWAVRNISYWLKQEKDRYSEHSEQDIHDALCGNAMQGIEGEYRTFERLTSRKHLTEEDRCM